MRLAVTAAALLLCSCSAYAQRLPPVTPEPTPTAAPTPDGAPPIFDLATARPAERTAFAGIGPDGADKTFSHWDHNLPALPTLASDAVIVGVVTSSQAVSSHDHHLLHSEYSIRVEKSLRGNLTLDQNVVARRRGGRVRFPSGQVVSTRRLDRMGALENGQRYVLFLKRAGASYDLLTAYRLSSSGAVPVDSSARFQAYRGRTEQELLADIRNAE
jgi:hypothetical protein